MRLFNGIENLFLTLMSSLVLANERKHVECNKHCVCVCVCKLYLVIYIISHFITL